MVPSTPYQESGSADSNELAPAAPSSSPTLSSTRRRKSPKALKQPLKLLDNDNGDGAVVVPSISVGDGATDDNNGSSNDGGATLQSSPKSHEESRATVSGTFWNTLCGKSKALLFGQLLSLFLAGTGAIQSSLYLDCNLSAPTFSMLSFYFPLCIICLTRLILEERKLLCKEQQSYTEGANNDADSFQSNSTLNEFSRKGWFDFRSRTSSNVKQYSLLGIPLQSSPLLYATVACTDVYANYVTILAFKYTTITSVSLFDALAIPSAMIVSRIFVGRKYMKVHFVAVMVCCVGIAINIFQDYREDEHLKQFNGDVETEQEQLVEKDYPYKMAGDVLAIIGGILFGITNTLGEVAVKNWGSRTEYLGCMCFFASIISIVQALALERDDISAFFRQGDNENCSETDGLTLLLAFSAASVMNYAGISSFLQLSEAAFLNLSLLTGDAWAVAFSVFAEGIIPPPSFYVALVITISGVFIYETAPNPVVDDNRNAPEEKSEETTSSGLFRNEIELADLEKISTEDRDDSSGPSVSVLT